MLAYVNSCALRLAKGSNDVPRGPLQPPPASRH